MYVRFKFKIWIEKEDGEPVIGKGGYDLIKNIMETGSIAQASKKLGLSYKFAWSYVRKINSEIPSSVEMRKGGKNAGGSKVSDKLQKVLELYAEAEKEINGILEKYNKKLNEILQKE